MHLPNGKDLYHGTSPPKNKNKNNIASQEVALKIHPAAEALLMGHLPAESFPCPKHAGGCALQQQPLGQVHAVGGHTLLRQGDGSAHREQQAASRRAQPLGALQGTPRRLLGILSAECACCWCRRALGGICEAGACSAHPKRT